MLSPVQKAPKLHGIQREDTPPNSFASGFLLSKDVKDEAAKALPSSLKGIASSNLLETIKKTFTQCELTDDIKQLNDSNYPNPFSRWKSKNGRECLLTYESGPKARVYYKVKKIKKTKQLWVDNSGEHFITVREYSDSKHSTSTTALIQLTHQINQLKSCDPLDSCPYIEKGPKGIIQNKGLVRTGRVRFILGNPLSLSNHINQINGLSFEEKLLIIGQIVEGIYFAHKHKWILQKRDLTNISCKITNDKYKIKHRNTDPINFNAPDFLKTLKKKANEGKYGRHFSYEDFKLEPNYLKSKISKETLINFNLATEIYSLGILTLKILSGITSHADLTFLSVINSTVRSDNTDVMIPNAEVQFSRIDHNQLNIWLKKQPWPITQILSSREMLATNWNHRPTIAKVREVFCLREGQVKNILNNLTSYEKTSIIVQLLTQYEAHQNKPCALLEITDIDYTKDNDDSYSFIYPSQKQISLLETEAYKENPRLYSAKQFQNFGVTLLPIILGLNDRSYINGDGKEIVVDFNKWDLLFKTVPAEKRLSDDQIYLVKGIFDSNPKNRTTLEQLKSVFNEDLLLKLKLKKEEELNKLKAQFLAESA